MRMGDTIAAYADYGIRARGWLAVVLGSLGGFAEGRSLGEEALHLSSLAPRGDTAILVHGCVGRLLLAQGDLEAASRLFQQGLVIGRTLGNRDWTRAIRAYLGRTYMLGGHLDEGHTLLVEAYNESIQSGALTGQTIVLIWLSAYCLLTARREEAREKAYQALDLAQQRRERGIEAIALSGQHSRPYRA
jgi:hypothetical protein